MVNLLIISVLPLAFLLFAAFQLLRQRHSPETTRRIIYDAPRSLFGEADQTAARGSVQERTMPQAQTEALLARAAQLDLSVLREAQTAQDLYREVLNALTTAATHSAESAEKLREIAALIVRDDRLRASERLAAEIIALWKRQPEKPLLAQMLRIAALADDVATYQRAAETAISEFNKGRLPNVSANYLRMLIETEAQVIAAEMRTAGAGFALKKVLSSVRRELTTANHQKQP